MANRPVFGADQTIEDVNFVFSNGFAKSQKQKNINKLHEGYKARHPEARLLDISRYSTNELGVALSAFNLTLKTKNGDEVLVEQAYQAGKVFQYGGPYLDLLNATPRDAKRDPRLQSSGKIIGFEFDGVKFPTQPARLFYTWLYLKGLENHPELAEGLMCYDAFTDIVYTNKSQNCQAHAASVYVALRRRGDLAQAMQDLEYLAMVLSHKTADKTPSSAALGNQASTVPVQNPKKAEPNPHFFSVNDHIIHPKYGLGTIIEIEKNGSNEYLHVAFPNEKEVREFSLAWVLQKCQY